MSNDIRKAATELYRVVDKSIVDDISKKYLNIADRYDRQVERIKELEEFVQMVAAGDSAEDSMKGILVHTYIHNAKTLLGQYPHEQ